MKMQSKTKPKKAATPESKRVCCSLLEKVKPDIENYIQHLIEAQDDFSKMRWAWGIITAVRQITEIKAGKKKENFFLSKM